MSNDPWKHRSRMMLCMTCMFYVEKTGLDETPGEAKPKVVVGRCRRHAPTMGGYPVVFESDWCGDHKVDEEKV